jgi:hypothetical protein
MSEAHESSIAEFLTDLPFRSAPHTAVRDDMHLVGVISLNLITIAVSHEREYSLDIDNRRETGTRTVGDLVTLVEGHHS